MLRSFLVIAATAFCAACSPGDSEPPGGAQVAAAADSAATASSYGAAALLDWMHVGDANWRIEGDAVHADSGSGFLLTHDSYRDFELKAEFWVSEDANSGIFVRCTSPEEINPDTCYEINIFDQRPDPTYRTGAIVDVAPPSRVVYTGGRWNRYAITARGPRLIVVLNDHTVVDVNDDRLAEGRVALQYGAGTVLFRNVELRAL